MKEIKGYINQIEKNLVDVQDDEEGNYRLIVDTPFIDKLTATHLGLGIVVLLLVNNKTDTIDRIALSQTNHATGAVMMSAKPFKEIKIPKDFPSNIIAKAIQKHEPQYTEDWADLFAPDLSPKQARFNQAGAGIECSYVFPLNIPTGGALIYSYYQSLDKISDSHRQFMNAYTNRVSWFLSALE